MPKVARGPAGDGPVRDGHDDHPGCAGRADDGLVGKVERSVRTKEGDGDSHGGHHLWVRSGSSRRICADGSLTRPFFLLALRDIIFLITAKFPTRVPGGYRFLLIGPLFDGLLGGMPTMGATNNAYIADCTPDGTRAQIYSRFAGSEWRETELFADCTTCGADR